MIKKILSICQGCKKHICQCGDKQNSVFHDWLNAPELVRAYVYRIYHSDTDTITYELTLDKEEAFKLDAYPIELNPTMLMR